MVASNIGVRPVDLPQEKDPTANGGAPPPMSQQNAADCHGHEMHPQKLVRLVGCHETNPAKPDARDHLH